MTIAILASWSLSKMGDDIYIPSTHYTYLKYVAEKFEKVLLVSPQKIVESCPTGEKIGNSNVKIVSLPNNSSYFAALRNVKVYKKVLKQVCKKVDLVYCRVPDPFSWMPVLLFKKKCIMHFVGDTIDATKYNEKWSWLKKKVMIAGYMPDYWLTLRAARKSRVYTNGHHLAERLKKHGVEAIPVISSTVYEKDLHDDFAQLPITEGQVEITYVGYVRYAKGMTCLMEFCKRLKAENINYHFNLIGGGEMFNDVTEFLKKADLQQFVTMHGHIENKEKMNEILRKSDLFFFPSLSEGSPRVIIEAMAQGVPVMSTPVGSLPGTFKDEDTIRFFDFNDATKAVELVREYTMFPEKFASLREKAYKMVAEQFTIEKFLSKVFSYEA